MGLTRPRASQIYDIDYKQAVRVITTSNITLSGGAPLVVDGVTLSLNDRVLVIGQSTASQNGIYKVTITGTGTNGTWARTSDNDATGELLSGTIVMVTEGSTYADTSWKLTTNNPITIGTTALTFEINTGNAFGTISANGTSVIANSATGTVSFVAGNNIVMTGNAGTDTITFAVKDNPSFSQTVTATGNITGGNLTTSGKANIATLEVTGITTLGGNTTINGHVLPLANITYDLGSPTQRWRSIYVGANTIDIGGATISADLDTGSLILTGPDGAEFILSGTSITNSLGTFGFVEIGSNTNSISTTSGALQVHGGAGITGNVYAGGIIDVAGNSIYLGNLVLKDNGANIFGLYAADGVTPATISQSSVDTTRISNGTSNVQVVGSNANVTVGVAGTSNVAVFYSSGVAITGDLSVTGNATLSGNIIGDRIVNGNTNIEVQTPSGNANITVGGVSNVAVFSTSGLNITGNVVASGNISTLGQLTASGNLTGDYLLANITFASGYNTTRLFNGNSEANIGSPGGNANITIGGVSNIAVFSTSGANVTGNLYATGNISGANILGNGRNLLGIETFRSFAVASGNTIVADSINDTFTFSAGSGITLVADPTTDTLTIAAAGEGSDIFVDGADFGTVTEVVTTTDDLGLITEAITSQGDLGEIVISGVFYPTQLVLPSYTVSTLPSAAIPGQMIYVSNDSGGAVPAFSDGTNWRRVTDRAIVT